MKLPRLPRLPVLSPPAPAFAAAFFILYSTFFIGAGVTVTAATATKLGDFEGSEEPVHIYYPKTDSFTEDRSYINMTNQPDGVMRFELRYRGNDTANPWWDGDRTTTNKDRQRAEVKGLGSHQKTGDTFEYTTTWRSSPGMTVTGNFFHLFQIKSTNGDSGSPLVVISITSSTTAAVRICSGTQSGFTVIRSFPWTPATWQTVATRVTTTAAGGKTGSVLVSVNGDPFQGSTGIELYRTDANDYRPKWGMYRSVSAGNSRLADAYIEHKDVIVTKISGAGPALEGILHEAEDLPFKVIGAGAATIKTGETAASGERHVQLEGSPVLNSALEFTLPASFPAGACRFIVHGKMHPSRGIAQISIDGVNIGAPWDQCAATQGCSSTDLGIIELAAGSHTIRLTAIGTTSTASSGKYQLSADLFQFIPILPKLTIPDDMTIDSNAPGGAHVTFACTAIDSKGAPVAVTCVPASGAFFPIGETTVQVQATDATGNTSTDTFTITVNEAALPPPVVTGLSPSSIRAGETLTITGTNLAGATVTIGGVPAPTLANTATTITLAIPPAAPAGESNVTVTTPGGASAPQTITILVPAPAVTTVTPPTAQPGATITITGSNLAGAYVTIGGVPATILASTATTITLAAPDIPGGISAGAITITTGGGAITAAQTLTIGTAPAIITQPVATQVAIETRPVDIAVTATAAPAPTHQWQYRTAATAAWQNAAAPAHTGAATPALTISDPSGKNNWQYRCALTNALNPASPVYSAITTLHVTPLALPAPSGIAASPAAANYKLYITDTTLHTITTLTLDTLTLDTTNLATTATSRTLAGAPRAPGSTNATGTAARFNKPRGLAYSPDATPALLVADTANNLIRSIALPAATVTTTATTGPDTTHIAPAGLAAPDIAGRPSYIADTGNHLIKKLTPAGETTILAGSAVSGTRNGALLSARFNSPAAIALDITGAYIYVADTQNHVIRLIDLVAGNVTTLAGQMSAPGATDGDALDEARFNTPSALAVDAAGAVYVADTGNSRIRVITTDTVTHERTVLTLAGDRPGFKDGAGTNAWFETPVALALAADGSLYIADTANSAIRRIAPDAPATVTTLAIVNATTTGTTSGTTTGTNNGGSNGNNNNSSGGGGAPTPWYPAALTTLAALAHARRTNKR